MNYSQFSAHATEIHLSTWNHDGVHVRNHKALYLSTENLELISSDRSNLSGCGHCLSLVTPPYMAIASFPQRRFLH